MELKNKDAKEIAGVQLSDDELDTVAGGTATSTPDLNYKNKIFTAGSDTDNMEPSEQAVYEKWKQYGFPDPTDIPRF